MKIEIDFDEHEFEYLLRESWYKDGKRRAMGLLCNAMERKIPGFLQEKEKEFNSMLKEAMKEVIERYKVRDIMKAVGKVK